MTNIVDDDGDDDIDYDGDDDNDSRTLSVAAFHLLPGLPASKARLSIIVLIIIVIAIIVIVIITKTHHDTKTKQALETKRATIISTLTRPPTHQNK